jgi:hypothetical protein
LLPDYSYATTKTTPLSMRRVRRSANG